jgi:hypothetical protein
MLFGGWESVRVQPFLDWVWPSSWQLCVHSNSGLDSTGSTCTVQACMAPCNEHVKLSRAYPHRQLIVNVAFSKGRVVSGSLFLRL